MVHTLASHRVAVLPLWMMGQVKSAPRSSLEVGRKQGGRVIASVVGGSWNVVVERLDGAMWEPGMLVLGGLLGLKIWQRLVKVPMCDCPLGSNCWHKLAVVADEERHRHSTERSGFVS